jgi:putative tricarboxylic transport membrane protein
VTANKDETNQRGEQSMQRKMSKWLGIAGLALALCAPHASALETVKFMIGANPGGGWDQTGRNLGKVLVESGAAKNVTFENKGGAGGTIGLAQFVNGSKGDPNALIVTGAVMVGAILQNKPPVTLKDATPVARLFTDYLVYVVPANSPIKTMKDVVELLKKDPGGVKWGGGSRGSVDHISIAMIAKDQGVDPTKINYVPFQGGGEASAAILGGHVTVGVSGFSEFRSFVQSGKMRTIAVSSPTRLGTDTTPTLKEQGINVEIGNWRGVYGAPGITADQRKALIAAVTKAVDQKSWKDSLASNEWQASLLTGDDFGKFMDAEFARLGDLMKSVGLIK